MPNQSPELSATITFKRVDSTHSDFHLLVTLLDKDLSIRDGDEHSFYAQFNSIETIKNAVVCYSNDEPIGCGAFKPFEQVQVEIKRMYVLPTFRGKGIGQLILTELEQWVSALNYQSCVLETGKKQPEAISLYQKAGYAFIENYGQYKNVANSVCMQKMLS
ncbi:MAG: GNAT family N-acetyltransferase [Ferruginibacter sp.]